MDLAEEVFKDAHNCVYIQLLYITIGNGRSSPVVIYARSMLRSQAQVRKIETNRYAEVTQCVLHGIPELRHRCFMDFEIVLGVDLDRE